MKRFLDNGEVATAHQICVFTAFSLVPRKPRLQEIAQFLLAAASPEIQIVDTPGSPKTTVNAGLAVGRQQINRTLVETDDGDPLPLVSSSPGPEKRQEGRELGAGIRDCLGGLLRPRQLAVTLYLQDVSVVESAKLLGWDLKQTRNLVYRGLADLRRVTQ